MLKRSLIPCFIVLSFFILSFSAHADYVSIYNLKGVPFQELYSPNNSVCWGSDQEYSRDYRVAVNTYAQDGFPVDVSSFPDEFKLFIPPGTVDISVTFIAQNNQKYCIVARYKHPPVCEYCSHAWQGTYTGIPLDRADGGISLETFERRDIYLRNIDGYVTLINQRFEQPLSREEAGWMYLKKLPIDGDRILYLSVIIQVDKQIYLDWYNSVDWSSFDEVTASPSSPSPPPPSPSSSSTTSDADDNTTLTNGKCSPEHPENCTDPADCQYIAGGHWYNGRCYAQAQNDTSSNTNVNNNTEVSNRINNIGYNPLLCVIFGGSYCNNAPARSGCDKDHLENCTSQAACERAGGYWDTNKCLKREPVPQEQQVKQVNDFNQVMIDLGVSNGLIKRGDKVHLKLNIPPYNGPVDVYGAVYFRNEHYLWFIPLDLQTEEQGVCCQSIGRHIQEPIKKTLIKDFDACALLGDDYKNKWDVYVLVLPSQEQEPQNLDDLSAMIKNSPYFLQYYTIDVDCSLQNAVCSPEHPELCQNQIDCKYQGQGYWYDNACHAEPQD